MYEPEWTRKNISSNTICFFFWVLFLVVAAGAGLVVAADVWILLSTAGRKGLGMLLRSLVTFAIPCTNALFLYILCSRSLLDKK